jgi:hypothetical protein
MEFDQNIFSFIQSGDNEKLIEEKRAQKICSIAG